MWKTVFAGSEREFFNRLFGHFLRRQSFLTGIYGWNTYIPIGGIWIVSYHACNFPSGSSVAIMCPLCADQPLKKYPHKTPQIKIGSPSGVEPKCLLFKELSNVLWASKEMSLAKL
jgi:hypothetical protein